jgi:5-methylcytosine-specific restriction endonuclease McrA
MKHRVVPKNPHLKSFAAAVLLAKKLKKAEVKQWLEFRTAFLAQKLVSEGDLVCRYCGVKGLVSEVPVGASKAQRRRLATLDHVIPRSKGGAEMDLGNLVVACYPCNQKKGDMSLP